MSVCVCVCYVCVCVRVSGGGGHFLITASSLFTARHTHTGTLLPTRLVASSDVGPPEGLYLVPLNRVLEPHVVAHAVRVGEGLGAAGDRACRRVAGIVLLEVRPHARDVLDDASAERTAQPRLLLALPKVQMLLLLLLLLVVMGQS